MPLTTWYHAIDRRVRIVTWRVHDLVGLPFLWLLRSPIGLAIRRNTEPNHWTLIRFPMAVVLAILLSVREDGWAVGVYILSVLTDRFDGEFARLDNKSSAFGTLLDTIADSVMQSAVLISINARYPALWETHSAWRLPLIAVTLEAVRLLGGLILRMTPYFARRQHALQPNMSGKFKMATMALSVVLLLAQRPINAQHVMAIAIALSIYSMFRHLIDLLSIDPPSPHASA
jgi:phosphatidylglycerophosphate synthase